MTFYYQFLSIYSIINSYWLPITKFTIEFNTAYSPVFTISILLDLFFSKAF